MRSTLVTFTFLFLVIVIIFTLIPRPSLSHPIVALKRTMDGNAVIFSRYLMDELKTFEFAFGFSPFLLALFCAWTLVTIRTTALRFTTMMRRFLAESIAVIQQFSYLRFATLLGVATGITLDANDIRGAFARPTPRGGLARPVASASQTRSWVAVDTV